jgi:hypothetical protein
MKVSELFRRLSYGELSNLAISGEGSGHLQVDKHPQIIQYTNDGLLLLYSRFVLRKQHLVIEQLPHITSYRLKKRYAESNTESDAPFKYIKDSADDPFEDDVIKILEVHDDCGNPFPLNDKNRPGSLFTPDPDTLQVPNPQGGWDLGIPLGVIYQARHPKLLDQGDDLLEQEIDLPFFLEGALQAYVGYKVYCHMNGQENQLKSQEYLGSFESTCTDIELKDLVNQTFATSHTKLEQRGFV